MVIRMRHTRAHTKNRRSHHALSAPTLAVCKNCGAEHRPHHMCLKCGFYKGRQVIDLAKKHEERAARMQAKRDAIGAQADSVAPSEAEAVAEAKPAPAEESKESKKE